MIAAVTVASRRVFVRGALGVGASAASLALLSGCGPLPRFATRTEPTVGFVTNVGPDDVTSVLASLREGLREEGLVEGSNVRLESRFAGGRNELLPGLISELLELGARVIVTTGATVPPVARQATDRVPIVAIGGDLVGLGLADSYTRPGGNMTGVSQRAAELNAKVIQTLVELVPGATRMANMINVAAMGGRPTGDSIIAAAERLQLEMLTLDIQQSSDLEPAFERAAAWGAEILYAGNVVPLNVPRAMLPKLALRWRLPSGSTARAWVAAGSLLAYETSGQYLGRRAAWYVARLLNGAIPAELPIDVANVFDMALNRTTLTYLGLSTPPHVAAQVSEWLD